MKVIAIVAGAMLAAALVMLKVQRDHEETLHRQRLIEMLQSQRDELAKLGAENARLSNLVALANSPANDPSDEMLRLRGEVATLRREAADNQRQNGRVALGRKEAHKLILHYGVSLQCPKLISTVS